MIRNKLTNNRSKNTAANIATQETIVKKSEVKTSKIWYNSHEVGKVGQGKGGSELSSPRGSEHLKQFMSKTLFIN